MPSPTGDTRLAGVIGWPVRHSRSPVIHNAAFAAVGIDWTYLALPVAPGTVPAALAGMHALGIEGLSVTMPHKTAVAAALERLTDDATALGAVNCVFRDGEHLVGDNTDGGGFVDSLRHDQGIDPSGMRCVVFGAGGAARAVVRSLAGAGAERIAVANRRPERAAVAASLAGALGVVDDGTALASADLVVNATPVGMGDDDAMPFDPAATPAGCVIADLVYHPEITPLLGAAATAERRTVGGLGMLVHQAGRAFRRWTGVDAPIDVMTAAARRSLS
ncbi:shikimate dehydrogenase [Actinospongicola halichondriae]|uniref:shikimate dehydrogenase n=1 Tax=Actinospongicola halichondriae TaxID=3236844 RepID=UPI003D460194